jgi:DNA-binding GntR family transcriptional regulator
MPEREARTEESLADETYRALLDQILSRQLGDGQVVQERRLAAQFGVSRSPMRDALGRLEGQGLLVRNGMGMLTVRVITLRDYLNSLTMRLLIEPTAAALACPEIAEETLRELTAMLDAIDADPDPDAANIWRFDDALHQELGHASGNPFLAETIVQMRRYTTIFERQRRLTQRKPGLEDHREILASLNKRDADAAREAMTQHLENVRQRVLASY